MLRPHRGHALCGTLLDDIRNNAASCARKNMRKAQIALVRLSFKPFDESGFAP